MTSAPPTDPGRRRLLQAAGLPAAALAAGTAPAAAARVATRPILATKVWTSGREQSVRQMPFGGGGLLRGLLQKPLPAWAAEIGCAGWPQLLLKFALSPPAVTCVVPGTRRREHLEDKVAAGFGKAPGPAFWRGRIDGILG